MSPTSQGAIVFVVTLAVLLSGAPVAFGQVNRSREQLAFGFPPLRAFAS